MDSDMLIDNYKGTEKRGFACTVCKLSLNNLLDLNFHYASHGNYMKHGGTKKKQDPMSKKYTCLVCDKHFRREQDLIIHDRWHKGGISYDCSCCGKGFPSAKILVLHMVKEHTGDISILGLVRNKNLNIENNLSNVCYQNITNITTLKSCKASLPFPCELNEQEKEDYEIKYSFFCDTCGKGFTTKWTLIRHFAVHSIEKSFNCLNCSKTFPSRERLCAHMKIHNEDIEFICEICGSCFHLKQRLSEHINQVHEIGRPFKCSICGKAFKMKNQLGAHVKVASTAITAFLINNVRKQP